MVFDPDKLNGLTVKHFYTDIDKMTGKIVLYNDDLMVGYVTYEKEMVENLFSADEYIKICEQNNIAELFPTKHCYYIGFLEVLKNEEGKGYGNMLMMEVIRFLDADDYSKLFIINACPYLREKQGETWQNSKPIPVKILVQFYERFGFKTFFDDTINQLMSRKTT